MVIPGFKYERKDRLASEGGGWIVYLSDNFKYKRKVELESNDIESVWLEIFPKHRKSFLLCFVYRAPQSAVSWYQFFEKELDNAQSINDHIVLTGDFNIDFYKSLPKRWETILSVHNMCQLVTEPTRVTRQSVTLIDHIYSTRPEEVKGIQVPTYCPGDHYPVSFTVNGNNHNIPFSDRHITITYRNFSKFNQELYINDLKDENFDEILNLTDPDEALDLWYSKLSGILNQHAPVITRRVKRKYQPKWLSNEIASLRSKRDFYHKKKDFDNYKLFRNKLTSKLRSCKTEYFSKAVESGKSTSELWKHLKELNSESKGPVSKLVINNVETSNPEEICEHFNNHFSSIAESIINAPKSNFNSPKLNDYVNDKVGENKFVFYCITPEDVYSELIKINVNKSTGLDGISPNILKISAPVICDSITHIFNLSLCTGNFPSRFKIARVTPVYKTGEVTDMNNYRPISVLPTLSKLFEKFVYSQLYEYLVKYSLIFKNQSGFRSKYSCQTALTKIVDDLLKEMDKGNYTGILFLDFKKAFDVVNHCLLLSKLKVYKLDNLCLKWFTSYLSDRLQRVGMNNNMSTEKVVKFGIPQGSILGPLLFLLYINDLPLNLSHSVPDLYADDTTIHYSSKSVKDICDTLNDDLINLHVWCNENDMVINTNKSNAMLVGTSRRLQSMQYDFEVFYNDSLLKNVTCEKLLGVQIDNTLSWCQQIDKLCSLISSRIGLLTRLKLYIPVKGLCLFYNGYILPLFDYCCTIWGETTNTNLDKLFKLQKRAARIILDAQHDSPSKPLFKELGWLTLHNRIKYHRGVLMYKCINNIAPNYLSEMFKSCYDSTVYSLRSTKSNRLFIQRPNTNFMKRTFQYSGTLLWNEIPLSLKNIQNIDVFKKRYFEYLINKQTND